MCVRFVLVSWVVVRMAWGTVWGNADMGVESLQTAAKAIDFYNGKVKELEINLQDLEKIVQSKTVNLRVVEDGELHTNCLDFLYLAMRSSHGSIIGIARSLFPRGKQLTSRLVLRQKVLTGEAITTPVAGAGAG